MPIAPHRNLSERAAHRTVTAAAAAALFDSPVPVDWPVSGDETGRQYGRDARRDMRSLWHSPAYYRTRAIVRHAVASLAVVATFALAGFAEMITR